LRTGAAERVPKLPNERWAPGLRKPPPLGARETGLAMVRLELKVFVVGRGAL